jgi:hypothetical protein
LIDLPPNRLRNSGFDDHIGGCASYFIPSGQVPSGEAIVMAQWYDEDDCIDDIGASTIPSSQDHGVVGAWTTLVISATPLVNADSPGEPAELRDLLRRRSVAARSGRRDRRHHGAAAAARRAAFDANAVATPPLLPRRRQQ